MTPKKKAKQLFEQMFNVSDKLNKYPMCLDTAKACALICVNTYLYFPFDFTSIEYGEDSLEYWEKVKQELEKL